MKKDLVTIKIIKCDSPTCWYVPLVDQVIEAHISNRWGYWIEGESISGGPTDVICIIDKEDAIELRRREKLEKIISKM